MYLHLQKQGNRFDVGIVFVFKVGIIIITFHFLFIRSRLLLSQILSQNFGNFFLFTSSFEFSLFFPFFSNKNCQVRKISNQKKHVGWGGGGGGEKPNILLQNFNQFSLFFFFKRK